MALSEYNNSQKTLFDDYSSCPENKGYVLHLEDLRMKCNARVKKHIKDKIAWTGYLDEHLETHRDKNDTLKSHGVDLTEYQRDPLDDTE